MIVFTSIIVGTSEALASLIALSIASISLPSLTKICSQPYDSKRVLTSSENALFKSPSKEISFESYNTISLSNWL